MASTPPAETDSPLENLEKPQTPEARGSGHSQHVNYDEDAGPTAHGSGDHALQQRSKWKFKKKYLDSQKTDWWFASTGSPLLAATFGPLANVTSICALVSSWRETIFINGQFVSDFDGIPYADPRWCYWINVGSLICGFLGNLFLLLNFTQRIRYIIALPATIICWYLSTGFLIAITVCMQVYAPPTRPNEAYTQGYWYAVASAAFYLICSMILMANMLGHFLGHYPDTFALSDAQRTLILQTMLFFIWLAGGAAVFSAIEEGADETGWAFADALYFCDVTILTVGFGDLYPTTNLGRGLILPYSVGGIIMLGLVISSIYKFMRQLGEENIIQRHIQRMRERTVERTVNTSFDLRQREHAVHHLIRKRGIKGTGISAPIDGHAYNSSITTEKKKPGEAASSSMKPRPLPLRVIHRKPRLILLREEKDRFEAMRRIQHSTRKFKQWGALAFSIAAFGILWCVGAVVFWRCEKDTQGMSYFEALYFCYISLLTIGYGDMAPKSNAGRCFFVVWSLIAVPTMTILVSDMGDTVVEKFKTWSDNLADFTVLPKEGIWRVFLENRPWMFSWMQGKQEEHAARERVRRGFEPMDPEEGGSGPQPEPERDPSLSSALALSIRRVSADLHLPTPKKYSYEEWVEFTRLIRQSNKPVSQTSNRESAKERRSEREEQGGEEGEEEGLGEWDWLGENSPLVSGLSESQWVLDRLCEAIVRVERRREGRRMWSTRDTGGDGAVADRNDDREHGDRGDGDIEV